MMLKKSFVSESLLESELNFINKIQGGRVAVLCNKQGAISPYFNSEREKSADKFLRCVLHKHTGITDLTKISLLKLV